MSFFFLLVSVSPKSSHPKWHFFLCSFFCLYKSDGRSKLGSTEGDANGGKDSKEDVCSICLDTMTNPHKLDCGHSFCSHCLEQSCKKGFRLCPTCRAPIGKPEGTQPKGCTMKVIRDKSHLPGYKGCGTIIISYNIPSGKQTAEHPHPGRHYSGDSRTAYLPDNKEGNKVLTLLQQAFEMRLIFTIGRSVTRDVDDVVVWNDIHHKTSRSGGPQW